MRKRLGLAVTECTWSVAFPAGGTQRRAATRLGTVAVAFPRERGREPNGRFRLSGGSSSFLNDFLAAFAMPAAVRQPASTDLHSNAHASALLPEMSRELNRRRGNLADFDDVRA